MTTTHRQFSPAAMKAAQNRAMCLSASMPATTMCSTSTATSIRIKEIGVNAPVSLFVVVLIAILLSLLQLGLISLVSLTLISLTGLGVLVGLTGLAPGEPGGD